MSRVGLVLGGGGISGYAFTTSVLKSIEQATGWDARNAEVIVGTSAGANAAGLLRSGQSTTESYDELLGLPNSLTNIRMLNRLAGRDQGLRLFNPRPASIEMVAREVLRGPALRPGRVLSGLVPAGPISTEMIGQRMDEIHEQWPDEHTYVTAVRLRDGKRVVFTGETTVALGDAVAASSAIPAYFAPVEIDGEKYIDGGVHSPTNADLLVDHDLDAIVVIAPMSVEHYKNGWLTPNGALRLLWKNQVEREYDLLRTSGHNVLLFEPAIDEARAMGITFMDPSRITTVVHKATEHTRAKLSAPEAAATLDVLRS